MNQLLSRARLFHVVIVTAVFWVAIAMLLTVMLN